MFHTRLLLAAVLCLSAGALNAQSQLTIEPSDPQPSGLVTDGTSNQTVLRFSARAEGADLTITDMTFDIVADNGLISGDVATATLYEDLNANAMFDSGEELSATTLDEAVTADTVSFTLSEVVATGTVHNFALAISFDAGAMNVAGTVETTLADGAAIVSTPETEIFGLPISSFITVSGEASELVIIDQPTDVQEDDPIAPPVVVELRDSGGNVVLGQSVEVVATVQSGPGILYGSPTAVVDPDSGRATFFDLRLDRPGLNYVLHFAAGTLNEDSDGFIVTAAPVPPRFHSSGACQAQPDENQWPALLFLLIPALVIVTWVLRRATRKL